jgi:hypothetical protein|tara:strand:+ start:1055 stop:1495 length:441 start_codon:yes stop_codon:yes gene_type:complete
MSYVFDIAAAKQASAIGKYNQSIQERNAQISEQEVETLDKQKEFDLAKFEESFERLQAETQVAYLKSGVQLSGTAYRVMQSNVEQAELDKKVIEYNTDIKQSQKLEEANYSRMQGQLARQQAKIAELGYYSKAGQSLMSMGSGGGK